jgi:hypothetical protein
LQVNELCWFLKVTTSCLLRLQVFEYLTTDLKKYMDRNGKGPNFPLPKTTIKVRQTAGNRMLQNRVTFCIILGRSTQPIILSLPLDKGQLQPELLVVNCLQASTEQAYHFTHV